MLLRISAASFSSPNVAATSGAPLLKAATLRWPAKIGGEEHSAQTEIIVRYVRRAMAGDIARTLRSRQLRAKEKGPRPKPARAPIGRKAGLSVIRTCAARRRLPQPSA